MVTKTEIETYLKSLDKERYLESHIPRFIESYFFIESFLKKDMNILDLGSYGHFGKVLEKFKELSSSVENSDFELREAFPVVDNKYDMVLCMEVLEHLKDRDSLDLDDIASFKHTGALSMLCEANRVLKTDGLLFLTTPNMSTYLSVLRILTGGHPHFFGPHVKEYSVSEVHKMLETTGFEIIKSEGKNLWGVNSIGHERFIDFKHKIEKFCIENGFSTNYREDDMFIVAKKISQPKSILNEAEYFIVNYQKLFPND